MAREVAWLVSVQQKQGKMTECFRMKIIFVFPCFGWTSTKKGTRSIVRTVSFYFWEVVLIAIWIFGRFSSIGPQGPRMKVVHSGTYPLQSPYLFTSLYFPLKPQKLCFMDFDTDAKHYRHCLRHLLCPKYRTSEHRI